MINATIPTYKHIQKAPWYVLLYFLGVLMIVVGWLLLEELIPAMILFAAGVFMLLLGTSFQHLSVADQGDHLLVRFGPLPLFQNRIKYADIRDVETGRTILLDGWGIHMSIRGGWVWNLSGWNCVVIHRHKGVIRIGTDDPVNLAEFLKQKIGNPSNSAK